MKPIYIFLPATDRDADEHFLFIAGRNREAAARFFQALDASCERLAAMPELGQRQSFGKK